MITFDKMKTPVFLDRHPVPAGCSISLFVKVLYLPYSIRASKRSKLKGVGSPCWRKRGARAESVVLPRF